jgi:[ribosomal protein S5]-alanine N-acetyltransferase
MANRRKNQRRSQLGDSLFLTTPRLILQPLTKKDIKEIIPLLLEKEILKGTDLPSTYSAGDVYKHVQAFTKKKQPEGIAFVIREKLSGTLIGEIDFILNLDIYDGGIGYWIGTPYWNKGYATEAVKKVLKFGFQKLGLETIWASCKCKNKASVKVLEKIGMHKKNPISQQNMSIYTLSKSLWQLQEKTNPCFEQALKKQPSLPDDEPSPQM